MLGGIKKFFFSFFYIEPEERLKVILLSVAFFLVIGGYSIARELKNSVFIAIVGREYLGYARIGVMVALMPLILLYSRLVDILRRHQLLYFYSVLYGACGLIFAYFLGHPVIGFPNTDAGPHRLFGWFFYLFVEGYSPFVVSLLWAFANSVSNPRTASRYYPLMVASSKVGGILSTGIAWILFTLLSNYPERYMSGIHAHQLLLAFSSFLLLLIPISIYLLMAWVPYKSLHGYEAAYQTDRQIDKERQAAERKPLLQRLRVMIDGMFSGLVLFARQPYIFGIFCTIFFYETINVLFELQRLGVVKASSGSLEAFSAELFKQIFFVHVAGWLIAMFCTKILLEKLGERNCLILMPLSMAVLMGYFLFSYNVTAIFIVYVIFRAMNYGFAYPIREALYIPTVKDIKFKSKSWIDAFGAKMAKATGASCSIVIEGMGPALFFTGHAMVFSFLIGLWIIASVLLGNRYVKAIENNEVIGETTV